MNPDAAYRPRDLGGRPDPRLPGSWCKEGVSHDHGACGLLWNGADADDITTAARWSDDQARTRTASRGRQSHVNRVAFLFDHGEDPAGIQITMTDRARHLLATVLTGDLTMTSGPITLTVEQAAIVARWAARLTSVTSPDYEVTRDFYNCVGRRFLDLLWEDGLAGFERGEEPLR